MSALLSAAQRGALLRLDHMRADARLMMSHEAACLALGIGVGREDAAGDTMHLARELEFVSALSSEVLTDPIKGREFVPWNASVPAGAETFAYDEYDRIALAEWITNYASRPGVADRFKRRVNKPMYDFGSSYIYSIQDLERAAYARTPLERDRALSARKAHEQFIDDLIAVGDSERGIEGLANSSAFQTVATVATEDPADDEPTDAAEYEGRSLALLANLDALVDAVEQNSKQNTKADALVLPLSMKSVLKRRYSSQDARSREKVWLENQDSDGVKKIDYWTRLETAGESGGPLGIAYKKAPWVLEFVLSYDYRELPPQAVGFAYQVLTYARVGGLVVRYALGCAKMTLDATAS